MRHREASHSVYCLAQKLKRLARVCAAGGRRSGPSQLTAAFHGLLGCQDERSQTGEGLRQLQERMLKNKIQQAD